MKNYTLIIQGSTSFSLSNETDSDSMTDYFPGIWGINSQKMALKYAKEYVDGGDIVTVTDYNKAEHHKLANSFIKELGLSQPLFPEPKELEKGVVTNGKPSTLGALKKYLTVGTKIKIVNAEHPERTCDTEVIGSNTTSIITYKTENLGKSWIYFQTAAQWSFDNKGATYNYQDNDGGWKKSFTIEYLIA